MALNATFQINVPALPNNDVWFINAQAWTNYWQNVPVTATLDAAATNLYVPVAYDDTIQPPVFQIDGINYQLATFTMITSLLARIAALDAAVQDMRTAMKNAGYINNAQ